MWSQIYVLSFMLIVSHCQISIVNIPIVNTVSGPILGSVASDGEYYEYLGIPYADSTSGSHRFQAPLPPPRFIDTFVANRRDIQCVRALGVGYEGTEDCLVANVYSPTIDVESRLPVMVWVKGKEFDRVDEHEYTFKNIVEQDVVVVTLNYRESVLGFLCLGTETAPGNAGLKDIVAGLRWVQENIDQFGGDPNDVTLFGHGSGAAAVDLVSLSPMANGLIHKVIAQSGSAFAPWAVSRDNTRYAIQVAEALGHTISDIETLSDVFARASVPALMAAINELDLTDNSLAFSPCIEREALGYVESFITRTPYEIISQGDFLQIPFMTGFVDYEGTIRSDEAIDSEWIDRMNLRFSDFLQADLTFESNDEREQTAETIRQYYFESNPVDFSAISTYFTYHGDTMILLSTIRELRMRAASSTSPLYLYQFSYKGVLGEIFVGPIQVDRAEHGEELAYLFSDVPLNSEESGIPEIDLTVADILIERWTNFAKFGTPTSDTSMVEWQPYTAENAHFIRIIDDDEINEPGGTLELDLLNPQDEKMSFWDSIYEEHFFDATSTWELDIDDEDLTEGSGEGEDIDESEEGSGEEDSGGEEEESGSDEDDDDDDGNAANKAVSYTFLIISLFAIIDKLHSTILLF